jgi:hypothetical protein
MKLLAAVLFGSLYIAIDQSGATENPYLVVLLTFLAFMAAAVFWACLRGFANLATDIWRLLTGRKNRGDSSGTHGAGSIEARHRLIRQIGPPKP